MARCSTRVGIEVVFTPAAVVIAMAVMGLPLLSRTARAGFEQVTRGTKQIAETLGAGPWRVFSTVTLPLASRNILAGAMLGFSRALGEFGATIVVAGSIPGRTRTLAVGIYTFVETGREAAAWGLWLVSALLAFGAIYVSNRRVRSEARRMIALTLDVTLRQQAFALEVRESASVEVLGRVRPVGSGKTSLLEAIAGLRTPDEGEIRVGDRALFSSASRHRPPGARAAHRLRAAGCVAVSASRCRTEHPFYGAAGSRRRPPD